MKQLFTEKYRPQNLDELIVPDRVMNLLSKGVESNLLLYGTPGTGKCVTSDTLIKIKNKNTNEISEITIGEFHKLFM